MKAVYLLIGTNLGNRESNLARARNLIAQSCGNIVHVSNLYETAAWGKTDQPSFLNQALELQTELTPGTLIKELLKTETEIGRIREEKYGPRLIDIDILLCGAEIISDPGLTIPHPELQNRRFALAPLAEIAASAVHPIFQKTVSQLLSECKDGLPVKKI